jgi:integrase/recombinase XerD
VRGKSRQARVVDLHQLRTLDAVSRYVMQDRPTEAASPLVFLVGGRGARRREPLSYQAVVRGFACRLQRLGLRSPEKNPHALRHTHYTAMWDGGMRELALQRRLGHASPESTRIYTRVSDEAVEVVAQQDRDVGRDPAVSARRQDQHPTRVLHCIHRQPVLAQGGRSVTMVVRPS